MLKEKPPATEVFAFSKDTAWLRRLAAWDVESARRTVDHSIETTGIADDLGKQTNLVLTSN